MTGITERTTVTVELTFDVEYVHYAKLPGLLEARTGAPLAPDLPEHIEIVSARHVVTDDDKRCTEYVTLTKGMIDIVQAAVEDEVLD